MYYYYEQEVDASSSHALSDVCKCTPQLVLHDYDKYILHQQRESILFVLLAATAAPELTIVVFSWFIDLCAAWRVRAPRMCASSSQECERVYNCLAAARVQNVCKTCAWLHLPELVR